jgi:hypothetical protein
MRFQGEPWTCPAAKLRAKTARYCAYKVNTFLMSIVGYSMPQEIHSKCPNTRYVINKRPHVVHIAYPGGMLTIHARTYKVQATCCDTASVMNRRTLEVGSARPDRALRQDTET